MLELSTDRARHRAATLLRRTDGLLNALRSRRRWWHERDASKFLLSAFVEDVRRGAAGVHEELRRPLLDYYLTTDMVAWKALKKALTTLTDLLAKLEGADGERPAENRAGQESEIPNFKGSDLGRFPLVSADFWTSDHLSERSRSVNAFSGTRARGTLTLKRR